MYPHQRPLLGEASGRCDVEDANLGSAENVLEADVSAVLGVRSRIVGGQRPQLVVGVTTEERAPVALEERPRGELGTGLADRYRLARRQESHRLAGTVDVQRPRRAGVALETGSQVGGCVVVAFRAAREGARACCEQTEEEWFELDGAHPRQLDRSATELSE